MRVTLQVALPERARPIRQAHIAISVSEGTELQEVSPEDMMIHKISEGMI